MTPFCGKTRTFHGKKTPLFIQNTDIFLNTLFFLRFKETSPLSQVLHFPCLLNLHHTLGITLQTLFNVGVQCIKYPLLINIPPFLLKTRSNLANNTPFFLFSGTLEEGEITPLFLVYGNEHRCHLFLRVQGPGFQDLK